MATVADLGRSRRRSRFHVLTSVRLFLMEAQSRSSLTEVHQVFFKIKQPVQTQDADK